MGAHSAPSPFDGRVRLGLYEYMVETGQAPSAAELAKKLAASEAEIAAALRRLHQGRALVLDDAGRLLMAPPWSAVPTPFLVEARGRSWFGNCIWDALGVLAALGSDGRVVTSCGCCGHPMQVSAAQGAVAGEGVAHFALPVRRWWEDIVFS